MQIYQKTLLRKANQGKTEIRRTTIQQTIYRQRIESSNKPTKENSTRRGYYPFPDAKKTTTRNIEVPGII